MMVVVLGNGCAISRNLNGSNLFGVGCDGPVFGEVKMENQHSRPNLMLFF